MTTKFLSRKLLNNLPSFTRFLNSASTASIAAVSPLNFDKKPEPNDFVKQLTSLNEPITTTTTLNLYDHQKLFASVSTLKLLRSSTTLGLASNERFVDFAMWVMNSRLMETSETTEDAANCVRRVHDIGFKGMLVYAVEIRAITPVVIGIWKGLSGVLNSPSHFHLHLIQSFTLFLEFRDGESGALVKRIGCELCHSIDYSSMPHRPAKES
ncbi:Methylenetetrahydrofolate reductase family protein isoform 2 [Hibiscus syriacus]|uniref:Methylenetetrahydrofolate reductase family protein isoform 2 n=1 Tax=Hibiscus syriacus TaxID=106335 RepID=A0A6A3CLX4_HIBSY|nr:Methylenetetrahydrofolate reductase family protein isoform 2 [Hibiscus syriacus]